MFSVKVTPLACLVSLLWKHVKSKANEAINSERSPKFILGLLNLIASSDCFLSTFIVHSKTSNTDNLVSGRDVPSYPLHGIYLDNWLHCGNLLFIRKRRECETCGVPGMCHFTPTRSVSSCNLKSESWLSASLFEVLSETTCWNAVICCSFESIIIWKTVRKPVWYNSFHTFHPKFLHLWFELQKSFTSFFERRTVGLWPLDACSKAFNLEIWQWRGLSPFTSVVFYLKYLGSKYLGLFRNIFCAFLVFLEDRWFYQWHPVLSQKRAIVRFCDEACMSCFSIFVH